MTVTIRAFEARDEARWRELWDGYTRFYEREPSEAVTRHTLAHPGPGLARARHRRRARRRRRGRDRQLPHSREHFGPHARVLPPGSFRRSRLSCRRRWQATDRLVGSRDGGAELVPPLLAHQGNQPPRSRAFTTNLHRYATAAFCATSSSIRARRPSGRQQFSTRHGRPIPLQPIFNRYTRRRAATRSRTWASGASPSRGLNKCSSCCRGTSSARNCPHCRARQSP